MRSLNILFALSLCMLVGRCSLAETYYVSLSGTDNGAGSAAAPWRTIQHAADALKPGDTLTVEAGIYREHIEMKHGGTPNLPITIAARLGAHVIITGADR